MTIAATLIDTSQQKGTDLKRRLIDCLQKEKSQLVVMAQDFYQKQRSDASCLALANDIIETVDRILAAGDWDDSLFLRSTVKPLKQIREDAMVVREELIAREENDGELPEPIVADNAQRLYLSLYQADGHDLKKWAAQLSSIASYMVGRPIYAMEQDVQSALRQKLSQASEAYAVVSIDSTHIIKNDFASVRKDRWGHELVNIEAGSLTSASIIEFVHDGRRYHFRQGQLVLKRFAKALLGGG